MARRKNRKPVPVGEMKGRLTVIGEDKNNKYGHRMLICECTCGASVLRTLQKWTAGKVYSCGCAGSGFIRQRTAPEAAVRRQIALRAASAVPRGESHPNAKVWTIYRPDNRPPMRDVKNLLRWIRAHKDLLQFRCLPGSVQNGMTTKSGWRGWRAIPSSSIPR